MPHSECSLVWSSSDAKPGKFLGGMDLGDKGTEAEFLLLNPQHCLDLVISIICDTCFGSGSKQFATSLD